MTSRVDVPVAFPDSDMIVLIAIAVVVTPIILMLIINLISSRRSKSEGTKKGTGAAAFTGFIGGLMLLVVGGSMAWALTPYLAGKTAFAAFKEYYDTNMVIEKSLLPVATFEDDIANIDPFPITVYRVAGGNPEDCWVYVEDAEYVLYCDDPLVEFSNN